MQMNVPILSTLEKAAQVGLRAAGRAVLKRARKLSPTDSGESDKSGFVRVDDLTVQVGFTSFISRLQHENLDWQHENGETAKFLEIAADEIDIGRVVAEKVRASLG